MSKIKRLSSICLLCILLACAEKSTETKATTSDAKEVKEETSSVSKTSIVVLGTAQDAGSPQIGCIKECCTGLFTNPDHSRQVSSLGVIDISTEKTYLFDATPDITSQVKLLTQLNNGATTEVPDGIFLTHAHIGHYTGLMYLGKEAMDAAQVPVYAMPRMKAYLTENGPWSLLVSRENIALQRIEDDQPLQLSDSLKVTPFLVPHRDEFSETVGYKIEGPKKSALFIPDIDKWKIWKANIIEEIKKVDYAFIDATFYDGKEINNRDISQIPHPFIIESLQTFKDLNAMEKSKIIFTHFNHTNPVMNPESEESHYILNLGYNIARRGDIYSL